MPRTFATLLLLFSAQAHAGTAADWMPAVCDCTVTGEALESAVRDSVKTCQREGDRGLALAGCMEDAGWERAKEGESARYARFCALTAKLLEHGDEDPKVVASTPASTGLIASTPMSNPATPM